MTCSAGNRHQNYNACQVMHPHCTKPHGADPSCRVLRVMCTKQSKLNEHSVPWRSHKQLPFCQSTANYETLVLYEYRGKNYMPLREGVAKHLVRPNGFERVRLPQGSQLNAWGLCVDGLANYAGTHSLFASNGCLMKLPDVSMSALDAYWKLSCQLMHSIREQTSPQHLLCMNYTRHRGQSLSLPG